MLFGLTALPGFACSIPVFRYALDRWPADPYRLEVSPAAAQDEVIEKFLRNLGANSPLNLDAVRLEGEADAPSRLLSPQTSRPSTPPIWSGALNAATLATLTNSPARAEIGRRILAGESAVWVLVESGNPEVDEAAAQKLSTRLTFLESAAQLPEIDPFDPTSRLGPGPALKVKFSVLRVRRDDAAEAPFIAMIGGSAPGGEALFAPVFGRGRVLGAWPADQMEAEEIDEACLFLLGACSCQVKQLNPGWDLLMAVDWDTALYDLGLAALDALESPPAESTSASEVPAVETVKIEGEEKLASPAPTGNRWAWSGAALLLITAGLLAWRRIQ